MTIHQRGSGVSATWSACSGVSIYYQGEVLPASAAALCRTAGVRAVAVRLSIMSGSLTGNPRSVFEVCEAPILREMREGYSDGKQRPDEGTLRGMCWRMRDKGTCARRSCPFEHELRGSSEEEGRPGDRGSPVGALVQGQKGIRKKNVTYGVSMDLTPPSMALQEDLGGVGSVEWCTTGSSEGPVFGPIWERAAGNRDMIAALPPTSQGGSRHRVTSLDQIPGAQWTDVDKPTPGYNFRAEVAVGSTRLIALLDTGASTNAIPEELVIALINRAYEDGMDPHARDWPFSLERWKGAESVTGVAKGQDLSIVGAIVLPIIFTSLDKRRVLQQMRFKIFGRGCSGWMGLIIGGPSLEPIPLGLGLRTSSHGHHLESLGITLRRCEDREVMQRVDCVFALRRDNVYGTEIGSNCVEANLWSEESDEEEG